MPGRVFAAIDIAPATVQLLTDAADAFTAAAPGWAGEKWVAPRLFHVTLVFFGDVPGPSLHALMDALPTGLGGIPAFESSLVCVRATPSPGRATMLWATLEDPSGLWTALARTVTEAALTTDVGHSSDRGRTRPIRPHVTLCRARSPRRAPQEALEAASAVLLGPGKELDRSVSVRCATLYSSTLGPGGPSYTALGTIALRSD